jgi:hypothetical protein
MYSSDSKGSRSYRLRRRRSAAERVAPVISGIGRVVSAVEAVPLWPHMVLLLKNLGLWMLVGIGAALVTTLGLLGLLRLLLA